MDFNKVFFVGKVKGTPNVATNANGQKQATFVFTVNDKVQNSDGQWINRPMDVTIYTQSGKHADVIERYVKDGHELLLECQYINWKDSNGTLKHAFKLLSITLGYLPRQDNTPKNDTAGGFPPV